MCVASRRRARNTSAATSPSVAQTGVQCGEASGASAASRSRRSATLRGLAADEDALATRSERQCAMEQSRRFPAPGGADEAERRIRGRLERAALGRVEV